MLNRRDNYPPNAYRNGCAFSGAALRDGEDYVVELPMGLIGARRHDGTYITDRTVCLSIAACEEVGATIGMHTDTEFQELKAHADRLEDRVAELEADLADTRAARFDAISAAADEILARFEQPAPKPARKTPAKKAPAKKPADTGDAA